MNKYSTDDIKRYFRILLSLLLVTVLAVQLSVAGFAAVPAQEPLYSQLYETASFRFRISPDWEIDEGDPEAAAKHIVFHAEDGFTIHALEVPNRVDPYVVDGFQENICALCEIPCPSGDALKADLYDFCGFTDETTFFDIYDDQAYVKGGVFTDESSTLIVAADCSEMTPEHDVALSRLLMTMQPVNTEGDEKAGAAWEGVITPVQEEESEAAELTEEADPVKEDTPEAVEKIQLTGVLVPSALIEGDELSLDPGVVAGDMPVRITAASMLKSSDDGLEDPYIQTLDTTAEAGVYYGGQIILEAESGYVFSEDTEVQLLSDPDDEESLISFESAALNEDGQLVIEFRFGQAGEAEAEEAVCLGRIDIAVPEAEYGKAPVQPEDQQITADGRMTCRMIFGAWTGNFDEAGNFRENETYMLPVTAEAAPGYFFGPDTEIYVNGICLLGAGSVEELTQAELYFPSATATQAGSYWITLIPEHAALKSSSVDWMPITESAAGSQILISVYPDPGYTVESVSVWLTNDPETQIPADLLNRQGNSAVYGFRMPEGAVTVRANLADPPPAETPQAVFTVTGPSSGMLTNIDTGMKWSLDGITYTPVFEIPAIIPEIGPGELYVVRSGDGVHTSDSEVQTITVLQAAEPEGLRAVACRSEKNQDGIICGVDPSMEWRASDEAEFTEIAEGETELTGLEPGSYEIRVRFTGETLASDTIVIQVDAYDPQAYFGIRIHGAAAYVAESEAVRDAREGDMIRICAEESGSRVFDSWTVWTMNGEPVVPEDPKNPETVFVMPADAVFVLARFDDDIDLGYAYFVEYDGNGADEGSMEQQVLYEKGGQRLNLNAFTREGLIFSGWARTPEAESAEFEDGADLLSPLVTENERFCTLYAVWQTPPPPEYKIMVSGGTAYVKGEAVSSAAEGAEVTLKAEERAGKVFVEWMVNENLISAIDHSETSFIMPDHDIVVMASYQNSQYAAFKADDAFTLHILKVPYSGSILKLESYYDVIYSLCGVDVPEDSGLRAGFYSSRSSSKAGFFYIADEQHYIKGGVYTDGISTLYVAADCTDLTPAHDAAFHQLLTAYQRASLAWEQENGQQNLTEISAVEITVSDAVYGESPERPKDYLGMQDGEAAYVITFDDWTGSFDDEGLCRAGEVYTLPIAIAVLPGYTLSPETELTVNGEDLTALPDASTEELAYLDYEVEMPSSYPITLLNENATLQSMNADEEEITEAFTGQEIRIRVEPGPGYMAASVNIFRTDDPQNAVNVPAELLYREGNNAVFSFVMPEYGVSVSAKLAGLPKAEMPEAEYTATGPETGTLSNVDTDMKWSQDGIVYTPVTKNPEELTGIRSRVIYVIRTGDGVLTTDSDPQKIYID